jgi:hypothetical protein
MTERVEQLTASSFAKSLVVPKVKQYIRFSRLSATTLWGLHKLKNGITGLKMAELQLTVKVMLFF